MDAIHKGSIVSHLFRHRAEQVTNTLLMLHIYIKVANHYNSAVSSDWFFASAELTTFHVTFHNVYTVFLVK